MNLSMFSVKQNEPTETGSRWIKTNNISCHCQLLHSSTSTAYTALHRPWHALAGTMNGCVIWRCSGHSPWWAVRLSYRNIWSIWHTVYEFVMNILLNSCSCISDVHPIVIMQPSCVLVPSCLLFYCTHTHTHTMTGESSQLSLEPWCKSNQTVVARKQQPSGHCANTKERQCTRSRVFFLLSMSSRHESKKEVHVICENWKQDVE